jgi:hypothetical protein
MLAGAALVFLSTVKEPGMAPSSDRLRDACDGSADGRHAYFGQAFGALLVLIATPCSMLRGTPGAGSRTDGGDRNRGRGFRSREDLFETRIAALPQRS